MGVARDVAIAVTDFDYMTKITFDSGMCDQTGRRRLDRRSGLRSYIQPFVETENTGERILAFAVVGRDKSRFRRPAARLTLLLQSSPTKVMSELEA